MKTANNPAYILSSARIPFAKSQTTYNDISRQELMTAAMNALVHKAGLKNQLIGDTVLGALMNSSSDWNLAREVVLSTELHPESPAYNIQRACGTGFEAAWQIAMKAHTGAIDLGIAGGVDTNSDIPIEVSTGLRNALLKLNKAETLSQKAAILSGLSIKDIKPVTPTVNEPRTLLSMGQHCELMVKEWNVSRAEQDELALASHVNASKAYDAGFFNDLVFPYAGLTKDGTVRGDTSLEKLAKLKLAYDPKGSLTAGNSSPLTDGAATVLIGNDKGAEQVGLKPLAEIIDVQVAAVDFVHGAGLLMAPTKAVAQLLKRNKLTFADFDYFEIHEAFAGQVLCNIKAWESESYSRNVLGFSGAVGSIDRKKLNVTGSSLAVGHPFAATGARIAGTLAKLLSQGGSKRGLISICTAGGMGIAAILESPKAS